jgi:phage terminase large subunit-like protein
VRRRLAAAGTVRLRSLPAQRGRGGGGAQPGLPGLGGAGHLAVTPGNEADFDRIEGDVLALCRRHRVASVGFDPWRSTQMAQRLRAEGADMLEFRATTQNFSPAVLELDAAMRAGRLRHDGDPVLEWCVGDVVGRPDRRGNLYPAKQRPELKIDAAVALMMAVGRAMAEDTNEGDLEDFLRNPVIA